MSNCGNFHIPAIFVWGIFCAAFIKSSKVGAIPSLYVVGIRFIPYLCCDVYILPFISCTVISGISDRYVATVRPLVSVSHTFPALNSDKLSIGAFLDNPDTVTAHFPPFSYAYFLAPKVINQSYSPS